VSAKTELMGADMIKAAIKKIVNMVFTRTIRLIIAPIYVCFSISCRKRNGYVMLFFTIKKYSSLIRFTGNSKN